MTVESPAIATAEPIVSLTEKAADMVQADLVLEQHGVRIFVDAISQEHLAGVTVDYVTGLHGAGFKFLNPNAARTCGCGSSFAT